MIDPMVPVPPRVISVSTMTFVKAVLIGLGIWFLWFIRDIVAIVVAALLLSALIDPFADWFARHRVSRGFAVVIVYIVLGLLAALVTVLLIPVIIEQLTQLFGAGPFSEAVADGVARLRAVFDARTFVQALVTGQVTSVTGFLSQVTNFLGGFVALFLVLVLTFYMVVEEDQAKKYFKNIAPIEYQPYLAQLLTKMQKKIGAWLRGQIVLGLMIGVVTWLGLAIIGVPYALLLGVIAGLLEIIPYVGPTLSLIPAAIIGFAQSPLIGALVVILFIIIQQVENNVLAPKVMQKAVGINPIVSIVALMVGFKVGGLVGAVLSIPVATIAAVILEDLFSLSSFRTPSV